MRIFFYAITFDRITKDRAAKFVDMLSATMGLLTGFSIISGVEIVYFGINLHNDLFQNNYKVHLLRILGLISFESLQTLFS